MTAPVAFFDFDGTLTRRDTLLPFLRLISGTPTFAVKMTYLSPVLAAYATKLMRNDVAKEIVLRHFLRGMQPDALYSYGRKFVDTVLPGLERPEGIERLRWHKAQGHTCVLVSASLDVYLDPWARNAGFDAWITSSLALDEEGRVSGRLEGGNCFGEEKVRRIKAWLYDKNCVALYAYGDSHGDLPMLSLVDEGYLWAGGKFLPVRFQASGDK